MGRRVMCAYPGCGERTRPAEGVTVAFGETRRVRYCGVFHALWGLIRLGRREHLVLGITPVEGTVTKLIQLVADRPEE